VFVRVFVALDFMALLSFSLFASPHVQRIEER